MLKQFIFLLLFFSIHLTIFGQKFHLIVVSATDDFSIGKGCEVNHNKIVSKFEQIVKLLEYEMNLIELTGSNVNNVTITNRINRLVVDSTDILVFYYSGHGKNQEKSLWPKLLVGGNISLDLLHNLLSKKKPQFLLTIGDCCNYAYDKELVYDTPKSNINKDACYKLFKYAKGDIIASSTTKGQFAYYSPNIGGIFTVSFFDALLQTLSGNNIESVNWQNFFKLTTEISNNWAKSVNNKQTPQVQGDKLINYNPIQASEQQQFVNEYVIHKVKWGETLWSLSQKYKVAIDDIVKWNKLKSINEISENQELKIYLK